MKKIILSNPVINLNTPKKTLNNVLKSNFINAGKQTREFEKKFVNY